MSPGGIQKLIRCPAIYPHPLRREKDLMSDPDSTATTPASPPGLPHGARKASAAGPTLPCTRCGRVLPADTFRLIRGRWRSSWCPACHVARTRQWRADRKAATS